jgi:hypothetical protein
MKIAQEIYQRLEKEFATDNAFVYACYVEGVSLGSIINGKLNLTGFDHLLEIRAFNNKKEIKSIFNDESGEFTEPKATTDERDFIDENMFLLDTKPNICPEDCQVIFQGKKTLALPFKFTKDELDYGIFIKVRNYIDFTDDDIAYFSHSRFVGFGHLISDNCDSKEEMYKL